MWRRVIPICLGILAVYATVIEPYWLKVTHRTMELARLQKPLRILLFSDLQLRDETGFREKWLLRQLSKNKYDLILTTGDLFDTEKGMRPAIEFMEAVSGHAPTFAVLGNWEHWSKTDLDHYGKELRKRGIPLLVNENAVFSQQGQQIHILGVDDPSQHLSNIPLALKGIPNSAFKILLAHAPGIFPQAAANEIDLVLCGHTHGGQVRIPFLPPLYLPPGCRPYVYGVYEQQNSKLLVTSGVGTSVLPLRFYCRPEIVSLTLHPAALN